MNDRARVDVRAPCGSALDFDVGHSGRSRVITPSQDACGLLAGDLCPASVFGENRSRLNVNT